MSAPALMVLATFLFATMGVCVKLASALYGTGEIVFYRGLIGASMLYFVSRVHAKISTAGATTVIEDAGSKNGTFLNGQSAAEALELNDGDRVQLLKPPIGNNPQRGPGRDDRPGDQVRLAGPRPVPPDARRPRRAASCGSRARSWWSSSACSSHPRGARHRRSGRSAISGWPDASLNGTAEISTSLAKGRLACERL